MNIKFRYLSTEDKLFMILNKQSFSLTTRTKMNSSMTTWVDEIKTRLTPTFIDARERETHGVCSSDTIKSLVKDSKISIHVQDNTFNKVMQLINLPSETKEDLRELIFMFGTLMKYLESFENYRYRIVNYLFKVLLPWKLKAYEITVRSNTDAVPADKVLQNYALKTLRCILEEIVKEKCSYYKMSLLIYQFCNYLEIPYDSLQMKTLVSCALCFYRYDESYLSETLEKLFHGGTDAVKILADIPDVDDRASMIIDSAKQHIENYSKVSVGDNIRDGLCIGDNIFDNNIISFDNLVIELKKIGNNSIKDYIDRDNDISFYIPEGDIGFLKKKMELPICKVMTNSTKEFYSLTKYNDKLYILFKIQGSNNKIYGISIPCEFEGRRNIVTFDKPEGINYILTM